MLKQFHTSKPQSLLVVCHPTLLKHHFKLKSLTPFTKKIQTQHFNCLLSPRTLVSEPSSAKNWNLELSMNYSCGYHSKCRLITARSFSALAEGGEKNLPWLAKDKAKQTKRPEKVVTTRSSWEESAEKFLKGGVSAVRTVETKRFEDRRDDYQGRNYSGEEDGEGETEEVVDPRWDKIKNRFNRVRVKSGSDRPEVRRWNREDSWGKKTWKEASESSLPRMGGEGVYGVGPVLAALSAGRREFYALYVQEGLDLSSNNRKKKDKKGFEKVLSMAEKVGLSIKEVSKHDLNMIVDNRPHQGLVLDASPLEMVGIKELEPASIEEESAPLWVALDEVTDPQNLGAIIRSAYFFGASGVVLCAKNSAPLSGVVSKASAGSLELMEMRSCRNMMQFLTSSAENGWRVLGGSISSRAVPLHEIVPGAPTILVLGSEGTGLRPLVERSCTELVKIPGNIPVDIIAGEDEDAVDAERDHSFSGITQTTSTTLQWTMAYLVKYPSIQEKLYNEICEVVGTPQSRQSNVTEEVVKEEDLQKMPYLKAVILEGLRRHPPSHFSLPHRVREDMQLSDYVIPKDSTIHFMVREMGLDPTLLCSI